MICLAEVEPVVEEVDPLVVGEQRNFGRMRMHLMQDEWIKLIDILDYGMFLNPESNGLKKLGSLLVME